MLAAIRKMLILKPGYFILYIVLLVVFIASGFLEYHSRYRDLLELIQNQASMTAAVIAQSGSGQAFFTDELNSSYIDRAIDLLEVLNRLDAEQALDANRMAAFMSQGNNFKITVFTASGAVDQGSGSAAEPVGAQTGWMLSYIQPLLAHDQNLVIAGVDRDWSPDGLELQTADQHKAHFLVAIPRDRGGALACHLSIDAEADYRYLTDIDSSLADLLQVKGLQYISLTLDGQRVHRVSKNGLQIDSTWQRQPLEDILFQVSHGNQRLLEVVRPIFYGSNVGEVRIGFNADLLFELRSQMIYQTLFRSFLLTVAAFALLIFFISRRDAEFLKAEKKRIEAEVRRLEKINRLREKQVAMGELAAGVAHEIRNPLNAIAMVAQRLRREFEPELDREEFLALTGTMTEEIDRINVSLQDFLEYSRPTPLAFRSVNVPDLFQKIQRLYDAQARSQAVTLSVQTADISFAGDPDYLQQALGNLVRNALEVCSENDAVNLTAHREQDWVVIVVQDTGSGIAEENLGRIFDLYYSTKSMGTGVGLALTQKIIADHQGTIDVTSTLGKGTRFEIRIPVKQ